MEALKNNAIFWIMLSIAFFELGRALNKRFKTPLLNPLLIAIALIIVFLKITDLSVADYSSGGDVINMMLAPATAVLAFSIYNQLAVLKKYFIPVVAGCLAGSVTSIASARLLCHLFGLSDRLTAALTPNQ